MSTRTLLWCTFLCILCFEMASPLRLRHWHTIEDDAPECNETANQVFSPCGNCSHLTCELIISSFLHQPCEPCPLETGTKPGCRCKDGYAWQNGICVAVDDCPKPCNNSNERLVICGYKEQRCQPSCSTPTRSIESGQARGCPKVCDELICACDEGHLRDDVTGKCIKAENCPKHSSQRQNGANSNAITLRDASSGTLEGNQIAASTPNIAEFPAPAEPTPTAGADQQAGSSRNVTNENLSPGASVDSNAPSPSASPANGTGLGEPASSAPTPSPPRPGVRAAAAPNATEPSLIPAAVPNSVSDNAVPTEEVSTPPASIAWSPPPAAASEAVTALNITAESPSLGANESPPPAPGSAPQNGAGLAPPIPPAAAPAAAPTAGETTPAVEGATTPSSLLQADNTNATAATVLTTSSPSEASRAPPRPSPAILRNYAYVRPVLVTPIPPAPINYVPPAPIAARPPTPVDYVPPTPTAPGPPTPVDNVSPTPTAPGPPTPTVPGPPTPVDNVSPTPTAPRPPTPVGYVPPTPIAPGPPTPVDYVPPTPTAPHPPTPVGYVPPTPITPVPPYAAPSSKNVTELGGTASNGGFNAGGTAQGGLVFYWRNSATGRQQSRRK